MAASGTSGKKTANEDASGSAAPKKGKKKFLILGILVILLSGGGAFAYMTFLGKDDAQLAEGADQEEEEELPAPLELVYVDLEPLFIPFDTSEGHRHRIVVMLSLEVNRLDESDRRVRSLMPRLRESYVRALTSRPFPGTEDGTIETVYLKNRIRAENNRILGTGTVNDVLVRDIRVLSG